MRFSATAMASAAMTSSIKTKEYSQLNANKYHAPPMATKQKPKAKVLNELDSYF